jgi:hypothetical protein
MNIRLGKWLFWIIFVIIFLYDYRYLAEKLQAGYFLACVLVRGGGLIAVGLLQAEFLWPRWGSEGKWLPYAFGLLIGLIIYTILQNAWDVYLYGYVIGDFEQRNFWSAFPRTLLSAVWFVAVSFAFYLAADRLEQRQEMARLEKELGNLKAQAMLLPHESKEELVVKSGTARVKIELESVTHVQGLKDYSIIYAGTEKVIVKGSLKNVEALFPRGWLVRIHKSYLVAVKGISEVHATKVTVSGIDIPVGRIYKSAVQAIFAPHQSN